MSSMLRLLYGPPLSVISSIIRGFIIAEDGASLIGGDWSNIEGRGLAWLAGEEWKLRAFEQFDAGLGPDIYIKTYSKVFGRPIDEVTKDERQIGKVIELACGFGGGVGAFQSMASTYGVDVDDETADKAKHAWRQAHPKVRAYWYDLERSAIAAVKQPGSITAAGAPGRRVKFKKHGSFLWCLLPSSRTLCYPYPQIFDGEYGEYLTYKTVPSAEVYRRKLVVKDKSNTRLWSRVSTFSGKIAENVTQAVCRDILAEAIINLEERGYQVVKHVHDEAIVEGVFKERDREAVEAIMQRPPDWAEGFPLAADCWLSKRYRKE